MHGTNMKISETCLSRTIHRIPKFVHTQSL